MNKIITTDITDPYLNLAIENSLLINTKKNQRHLFLYANRPCVVIGRFQNPWIECNLPKMFDNNISLVRRQSGGGCVFHDLNNINFSFISDRALHSQAWNHEIVVQALGNLNIKAYATKRGDIRLDDTTDRKISGSAFKQKKDQAFHHGTMLITSNLDNLNDYISSNKQDLDSKSISSVRSVVANITEINSKVTSSDFQLELVNQFKRNSGPFEEIFVSKDDVFSSDILSYAKGLKEYNWLYTETPKFVSHNDIQTKQGTVSIEFVIKKTKIESLVIISETVQPILINELEKNLLDTKIEFVELESKLRTYKGMDQEFYNEIIVWLINYFNLDELPSGQHK